MKRSVLVMLFCAAAGAWADASVSRLNVERLHAGLVQAAGLATHAEREALLRPVVEEVFDVDAIARISAGRATWRSLDEAARAEFVARLTQLIAATYAERFDTKQGLRFVTDEAATAGAGVVVKTRLVRKGEEDVTLDYFLRRERIFDVLARGVSDLSLRKADYASIIGKQGYAALLEHIRVKIAAARGEN